MTAPRTARSEEVICGFVSVDWLCSFIVLLGGSRERLATRVNTLSWDIRKHFCTEMVVKHWSRLPREVVDAPSLSVLNRHLDNALHIL